MAATSDRINLKNVRLAFPSLFRRAVFDGEEKSEGKYEATLLISKETPEGKALIAKLESIIEKLLKSEDIKVPRGKWALRDGDDVEYDGFAGNMSLKAGSNRRPTVLNRDKTPIVEDDELIYGGCYVNAIVDFWVQDNKWGKRVNANLFGVQLLRDGEPFGAGNIDVTNDFDEIDDDDFDFS